MDTFDILRNSFNMLLSTCCLCLAGMIVFYTGQQIRQDIRKRRKKENDEKFKGGLP